MSNDVTNLCRPLRLKPTPKCVLMALADRADDSGLGWPSLAWIQEWTCFGRTTVIEALSTLEQAGLITLEKEIGRNSRCQIDLDKVASISRTRPGAEPPPVREPDGFQDEAETVTRAGAEQTGTGGAPVREAHPSGSRTPTRTAAAPLPVREPDEGGTGAVPDTSIDINKTSIKTKKEKAPTASPIDTFPELRDVDPQHMADWLKVRKAKRAGELSVTSVAMLARQAQKAGITVREAVACCAAWEWRGFDEKWFAERGGRGAMPVVLAGGGDAGKPSSGSLVPWWQAAGFDHPDEAANFGCREWNATQFRDGKRIEEAQA